jgi:hypothetical protein
LRVLAGKVGAAGWSYWTIGEAAGQLMACDWIHMTTVAFLEYVFKKRGLVYSKT